ncbi:30S ribosomal protein S17 [bacterium]|nr:30S ribosomal protein S17 [bacterium]
MAETKDDTALRTGSAPQARPRRAHQQASLERGERKFVIGLVTSDKMEKTITVQVTRLEKHKKYKKYMRRHSKFYAHDEKREAKVGDTVQIQETRPLSKLKRWRLVKIMARAGETGAAQATS